MSRRRVPTSFPQGQSRPLWANHFTMTTLNIRSDPMATWECAKQIQASPTGCQLLTFICLRKAVLDAFTCCKESYLKRGLIYRSARVAFSLALIVYHVLEVDLWQVYACSDVGAPCPQTLDVSRPSQRCINLGCLLMLPLTVFTIDRAYPNT